MEQALVFATTAGLAFWYFRDSYTTMLDQEGDLQGLRSFHVNAEVYEPITFPSHDNINLTMPGDLTPALRKAQQQLINTSRFESRHFTMDALRARDTQTVGLIQDSTLPNFSDWTKGFDQ